MSPLSNGSPKLLAERKLISLVKSRELLYKGNGENIPFGKLKMRANALWAEIASLMGVGWTVAECKRKWSHIRNSYSRHLRNEVTGATTMTGRAVSKWHLADELEFLRAYMATEFRLSSAAPSKLDEESGLDENSWGTPTKVRIISGGQFNSFYDPTTEHNYLTTETAPYTNVVHCEETTGSEDNAAVLTITGNADHDDLEVTPAMFTEALEDESVNDAEQQSNSGEDDLIRFFRGVEFEYNTLNARRKRLFKQRCLGVMYQLMDEQEKDTPNHVTLYSLTTSSLPSSRVKVECNEETINSEIEVITED